MFAFFAMNWIPYAIYASTSLYTHHPWNKYPKEQIKKYDTHCGHFAPNLPRDSFCDIHIVFDRDTTPLMDEEFCKILGIGSIHTHIVITSIRCKGSSTQRDVNLGLRVEYFDSVFGQSWCDWITPPPPVLTAHAFLQAAGPLPLNGCGYNFCYVRLCGLSLTSLTYGFVI